MQFARQAVAFLRCCQFLGLFVNLRVLDGGSSALCQGHQQAFLILAEVPRLGIIGAENTKDLFPGFDRHLDEGTDALRLGDR